MAEAPLVLVLAADEVLRLALAEQVAAAGYRAEGAAGLGHASRRADLLLLAGDSAAGDALAVCRAWRRGGNPAPILALVEREAEAAPLLAAGAAAALVKPVRIQDLAGRLAALIQGRGGDAGLPVGRYRFRPSARLLVDEGGHGTRLTEKEAAILLHLVRAGDRLVPRGELLDKIWGYGGAVDTHTVETHIYRLRRKLGDHRLLVALEGGYRLGRDG